jgi:hypothetical protein
LCKPINFYVFFQVCQDSLWKTAYKNIVFVSENL